VTPGTYEALTVFMSPAPASGGRSAFALYAWKGAARPRDDELPAVRARRLVEGIGENRGPGNRIARAILHGAGEAILHRACRVVSGRKRRCYRHDRGNHRE
jgi:hypothetical protein